MTAFQRLGLMAGGALVAFLLLFGLFLLTSVVYDAGREEGLNPLPGIACDVRTEGTTLRKSAGERFTCETSLHWRRLRKH